MKHSFHNKPSNISFKRRYVGKIYAEKMKISPRRNGTTAAGVTVLYSTATAAPQGSSEGRNLHETTGAAVHLDNLCLPACLPQTCPTNGAAACLSVDLGRIQSLVNFAYIRVTRTLLYSEDWV